MESAASKPDVVKRKRVVDKDRHRFELLQETARVISHFGVAGTTVDRISQESRLSRGMINLHFKSKENLFREILRHIADKYAKHWKAALDKAGDDPLEKATALIASDFSPEHMNRVDAAVWIAFRAEVRDQSDIRQLVNTRDRAFSDAILACCTSLAHQYKPDADPRVIADAIATLLEGYLVDFHLNPNVFDRDHAQFVCTKILRSYFDIAD